MFLIVLETADTWSRILQKVSHSLTDIGPTAALHEVNDSYSLASGSEFRCPSVTVRQINASPFNDVLTEIKFPTGESTCFG